MMFATCLAAVAASSPVVAGGLGQQGPSWAELSPANRQVLAPLAPEWDSFDPQRKQKWLGIANHYPMLAPIEQQRVQQQMGAWAHLTPDQRRIAFHRQILAELARAIADGAKVRAYHAWTLVDNFEWAEGWNLRFGLIEVDPLTQERRIRPSGQLYSAICSANALAADAVTPPAT